MSSSSARCRMSTTWSRCRRQPPGEVRLPPVLRHAGATVTRGFAVVSGIGVGRALAIGRLSLPDSIALTGVADAEAEIERIERALGRLLGRYDERLDSRGEGVEADVLRAHRSVARDPEFSQRHRARRAGTPGDGGRRCRRGRSRVQLDAGSHGQRPAARAGAGHPRRLPRPARRGLRAAHAGEEVELTADSVCVADTMTPGQLLALDRRFVKGLVLAHGGTTSHTVILARSSGIPTVVGVTGLDAAAIAGQEVVVDGDLGVVVTGLTDAARRYYDMERTPAGPAPRAGASFLRAARDDRGWPVGSKSAANVGSAADVAEAVAGGAEGIGPLPNRDAVPRPEGPAVRGRAVRAVPARAWPRPAAGRSSSGRSTSAATSPCPTSRCRRRTTRSSDTARCASTGNSRGCSAPRSEPSSARPRSGGCR